jgi:hypothetical protein
MPASPERRCTARRRGQAVTDQELTEIALNAEKYNGAGRDTVLKLVARVRYLQMLTQAHGPQAVVTTLAGPEAK